MSGNVKRITWLQVRVRLLAYLSLVLSFILGLLTNLLFGKHVKGSFFRDHGIMIIFLRVLGPCYEA